MVKADNLLIITRTIVESPFMLNKFVIFLSGIDRTCPGSRPRRAHCILHVSSDTEQLTDVITDNLHHIAQHNYSYFPVHIITLYWLTYSSKTRDLKQTLLVTTEFFWLKFYLFIKKKMTSLLFNFSRIHGPKACAKNNQAK